MLLIRKLIYYLLVSSNSTESILLHSCSPEPHYFPNPVLGDLILYPEQNTNNQFTLTYSKYLELLLCSNAVVQAQYLRALGIFTKILCTSSKLSELLFY